jgi:hypothetical protein
MTEKRACPARERALTHTLTNSNCFLQQRASVPKYVENVRATDGSSPLRHLGGRARAPDILPLAR